MPHFLQAVKLCLTVERVQDEARQGNTSYRLNWKYPSVLNKLKSIMIRLIQLEFKLRHQEDYITESCILRSRDFNRFLCCRALWSSLINSFSNTFLLMKARMLYVWFEMKKRKCSKHKRTLLFKSSFLQTSFQQKTQN